jgi:hypothetical protein
MTSKHMKPASNLLIEPDFLQKAQINFEMYSRKFLTTTNSRVDNPITPTNAENKKLTET